MKPLHLWGLAIRPRIVICAERRRALDSVSLIVRSTDAKARYKPPHAPGSAYSPGGRRIKDWEHRR